MEAQRTARITIERQVGAGGHCNMPNAGDWSHRPQRWAAHVLEMYAKLRLSGPAYIETQQVYRGRALIALALLATAAVIPTELHSRSSRAVGIRDAAQSNEAREDSTRDR